MIGLGKRLPVYDGGGDVTPEVPIESTEKLKQPIPWLVKEARVPEGQFTGRSYLDRPNTLAGAEDLYRESEPSFRRTVGTTGMHKSYGEHLIPIGPQGDFQDDSIGSAEEGKGFKSARAEVPNDALGVIHTHPYGLEPVPSKEDYDASRILGRPNFMMNGDAVYVASPNGDVKHPIKVADVRKGKLGWNKEQPVIVDKPSRMIPLK
jgi:hypothetical protein